MSTPEQRFEMEELLFASVPASAITGPRLLKEVRSAVGCDEIEAPGEGWRILVRMLDDVSVIDEGGHHVYIAARHLLGLVPYPSDTSRVIPFTDGLTWAYFKRERPKEFKQIPPPTPLTLTRRQILAARSGGYGLHWTNFARGKNHRSRLAARLADDFVEALKHESARHPETSAGLPEHSELTASDVGEDRPVRSRFSRWKVNAALASAAVLIASVAVFWDQGDGDIGEERRAPGAGSSAYWEAGWGPDRRTFPVEDSPTYPVFNSNTGGPIGDERNFVSLKRASDQRSDSWTDDLWVSPKDEVLLRVYVNNSGERRGAVPAESIQDAVLKLNLTGKRGEYSVGGTLSAVNAHDVWDGATIHGQGDFDVQWVPGSLKLESNAFPGPAGLELDLQDALNGGVSLGGEQMDGVLEPGYQSALYVTAKLRVESSSSK